MEPLTRFVQDPLIKTTQVYRGLGNRNAPQTTADRTRYGDPALRATNSKNNCLTPVQPLLDIRGSSCMCGSPTTLCPSFLTCSPHLWTPLLSINPHHPHLSSYLSFISSPLHSVLCPSTEEFTHLLRHSDGLEALDNLVKTKHKYVVRIIVY